MLIFFLSFTVFRRTEVHLNSFATFYFVGFIFLWFPPITEINFTKNHFTNINKKQKDYALLRILLIKYIILCDVESIN